MAVVVVTGALGWLLSTALALHVPHAVTGALAAFDVVPPPPPPPAVEKPRPQRIAHRARLAPAPAGKRAAPTPVVLPPPVVPLPVPLVVAAPVPGVGAARDAGASDQGTGTGAGGAGNGRGGGGDGEGGQDERLIRDKRPGELPPAARRLNGVRIVGMRWVVGVDGRIHDCRVTRSSGDAELDAETCDILTRELRYAPARDAAGRKVPVTIDDAQQRWDVTHAAPGSDQDDGD